LRLGVYADLLYRRDGETVTTDQAFIRFVGGLAELVEELVVFGRLDPEAGRTDYELPARARFVPLPYYPRSSDLRGVARALGSSRRAFAAELGRLDAVWLFGPHPLSLLFARAARRRGIPVVLGIRQSFPDYIARRLPSRAWLPAVGVAHGLELAFRQLARRVPAVVVGEALARSYAGGTAPVLAAEFSLVGAADLVAPTERDWTGTVRLLSVGRLDPEKNPLLLPEIVARLRGRGGDWRLDVAGTGPLAGAVRARARELGADDAVSLLGAVANGPPLWQLYRSAHALLHVSFTEGLPQVLVEAEAAALPIVATAVGGVPDGLGHGSRGLLVPPDDADAAVAALERLRSDAALRRSLVEAALEHARGSTREAQLARVAAFLEAAASSSPAARSRASGSTAR
jgi:glycosyltransferase involved in cell wall biosynthesis